MGWQEHHDAQPSEMQSPAHGEEYPHVPVRVTADRLESSCVEKGGLGAHQDVHVPAACPCSKAGQQPPRLH